MNTNKKAEKFATVFATVIEGFKIESGIEVPPMKQRYSDVWSKIENSMKVGQSVLFPKQKAAWAFSSWLRRKGIPIVTRQVRGGIRIWKV